MKDSASQPEYDVVEQLEVLVPVSDGTLLATNIFLPDGDGPWPTVLERTPYDKGGADNKWGHFLAERGYVYVVQDVRGRFGSGGDFVPPRAEGQDGFDVQTWVAAQTWCDGNIGTIGDSYGGFTVWQPAPYGCPAVKSMLTGITGASFYDIVYQQGAIHLAQGTLWTLSMTDPPGFDGATRNVEATLNLLPLSRLDVAATGRKIPFLQDVLAHPRRDEYWEPVAADRYEQIDIPVLHVGGWYDMYGINTVKDYEGMVTRGPSEKSRRAQRLLMGPCGHGASPDGKFGDLDFGPHSFPDKRQIYLQWFDSTLKGMEMGPQPPVRIFVMGENAWRDEEEWPLERTQYTEYGLSSEEGANTRFGDGLLSRSAADIAATDTFTYDPADPVPTVGGAMDQREVEKRSDVLVYTTPVLEQAVEVTGHIKLVLYASSDAPDTDFTAKLVDVHPMGYAQNLTDGIVRASFRESDTAPSPIVPGQIYRYEIDVGVTSNLFHAGHRIRLEVSSSNFPRFDRNQNTGHAYAQDAELAAARQTIYHGGVQASHLTLPVIPR
ncbi:MAG: CocE/NonD family hydrolase [Candidatus Latescibacteria bacterium]|nr:CocE/NonD family hydrolase [Candidatus Latescibacterota bacterium]